MELQGLRQEISGVTSTSGMTWTAYDFAAPGNQLCVMKLGGFQSYTSPLIQLARRGRLSRDRPSEEVRGQAAVIIDKDIPQTEPDTTDLCKQTREIVALRTFIACSNVTFVSVYLRPGRRGGLGADWIKEVAI